MSYARRPLIAILRGPLLQTPQGLVVLIVCVAYLTLLPFVYTNVVSLLGKTNETGAMICLAWPIITCLHFVREGVSTTPEFRSSVPRALWLLLIGAVPLLWPLKNMLSS